MAEILITHSYFLHFDPKQWKAGLPYPPLGTLYAAAVLKKNGYHTAFHDTMFAREAGEIQEELEKHAPRLFVIYDDGFNYLTKMCLTNMREAAFEMIRLAKQAGCLVAISSSDSTDHAPKYLDQGADYIIAGEGEQTLAELADHLLGNKNSLEEIDGLVYRADGVIRKNTKRDNLRELDTLPLPAWELLDITRYKKLWLENKGYFSLNMVTTRGCPFKCNWCAKPIYGNRYNSRSPQEVVTEIMFLIEKFGMDHTWFADDIFGLKPQWVEEFAKLIRQEGITFKFKIQSRADLLLEEDTIRHLADAGCEEIWVGAESGSQKILDAMDKGTTIQQIEKATELMKQAGIRPCFFLQFGYPGEHKEDIEQTIGMVKKLMPHDIGISVSYPLPGTRFFENVKAGLQEKQNWTDSDELMMMFPGTYPADFYKKLQRYVHFLFRKWTALRKFNASTPVNLLRYLYYHTAALRQKLQLKKYAG